MQSEIDRLNLYIKELEADVNDERMTRTSQWVWSAVTLPYSASLLVDLTVGFVIRALLVEDGPCECARCC